MHALVWLALFVVVYAYVGYPLIAALLATIQRRPVRSDPQFEPTVSVCIAAHNAGSQLAVKLNSLAALDYPHDKIEFWIYSDGSTDATARIARDFAQLDPRFQLLSGARRMGKPTALNHLRRAANGEVLVLTDARQPIAPQAVRALVARLADPEVGCVSGSLRLRGKTGASAYWRYESLIRHFESVSGRLIGVTGALYAVRRADFPELPRDVILDDMWVPLDLVRRGQRNTLAQDAIAYDQAFDDGREFARKVRTLAGNYQLMARLPTLMVPLLSPVWFAFVSHKVARLLCPWALAVLLMASTVMFLNNKTPPLEALVWGALIAVQLLFYLLALLGHVAGRVARLARTFVVLNAAAVVALWRFARGVSCVMW